MDFANHSDDETKEVLLRYVDLGRKMWLEAEGKNVASEQSRKE